MLNSGSVTDWLQAIEGGNDEFFNHLVERYSQKLVAIARKKYSGKFGNIPRPEGDEEDAVQCAWLSFWARTRDGRIHGVINRHQLWKLLVTITIRKVYDQRERATAQKRGGAGKPASADQLEQLISGLHGPEAQLELKDTYRAAMDVLGDAVLRRIAAMDLEGRSRPEIAEALVMTERTVYRKLELIHEKWDGLAHL